MKRFIVFFNGRVNGSFKSERAARYRFLKLCAIADYKCDEVSVVDLELDGKAIAYF